VEASDGSEFGPAKKVISWKAISLLTLIPLVPGLLAANNWYFEVHDRHNDHRYVKKTEFQMAQATSIDNSSKLDGLVLQVASLQVQSAVTVVGSFQQEYDRHMRTRDPSAAWEVERDRLKRQLDRAIAYRDCLMTERSACDQLRGW
jgi:hypothetical protein